MDLHRSFYILLLIALCGGTFWLQHIVSQEPAKAYHPTTAAPVDVSNRSWQEKQEAYDAFDWGAWEEKADEIRRKVRQTKQAQIDALPATEAEQERYDTDKQFKREVHRKVAEASEKMKEAYRMQSEHEQKKPPIPYVFRLKIR